MDAPTTPKPAEIEVTDSGPAGLAVGVKTASGNSAAVSFLPPPESAAVVFWKRLPASLWAIFMIIVALKFSEDAVRQIASLFVDVGAIAFAGWILAALEAIIILTAVFVIKNKDDLSIQADSTDS